MKDEPIITITEPEVTTIKSEKGYAETYIYNYENSHVIYKRHDLGSFEELLKQKSEINDLREAVAENYKYILFLHEIFEQKIMGKKGKCTCGKKGTYCYDPYDEDINEIQTVVCLCKECYRERVENI